MQKSQLHLAGSLPVVESEPLTVRDMKPVSSAGPIRATFAVDFLGGALTIKEFKIVQRTGQTPWVAPPSREWRDQTGSRRFTALVELDKDLLYNIQQQALAQWENLAEAAS